MMKRERLQSDFKPLINDSFSDSLQIFFIDCGLNIFSSLYERTRFGDDDPKVKTVIFKFINIVFSVIKIHTFKVKDLLYLLSHVNKVLPIARNQRIDEKVYSTILDNFLNYYQTKKIVNMLWKKSLSEDDKLSLKHSSNFTIHYLLDSIPELNQKAKNIIILLINDFVVPSHLGESIKINTDILFKNILNYIIETMISNLHSDIRISNKIPLERFLLKDTTEQEAQRKFFYFFSYFTEKMLDQWTDKLQDFSCLKKIFQDILPFIPRIPITV